MQKSEQSFRQQLSLYRVSSYINGGSTVSLQLQLLMEIWMAMIPFICILLQEVSNQCHSWGITSETGELRLVGRSLCMRFHQLSGR